MTRIVINDCYGGFALSETAEALYKAYAGIKQDATDWTDWMIDRNDPILLQVIDQLGVKEASGQHASLKIVEVPDEVEWYIEDNDGNEHVAETHRTWS